MGMKFPNKNDNNGVNFGERDFAYKDRLDEIGLNVKDFGAVGDGITDDTQSIQNAIDKLGYNQELYFPPTSEYYLISSPIIGKSNIRLKSIGGIIRANTRIEGGYFEFDGCVDVKISGLTFDQNEPNLPTYQLSEYDTFYNQPLLITNGSDFDIRNNKFINLYNQAINFNIGNGVLNIEDNIFLSETQEQIVMANHVRVVTFDGKLNIENNNFKNQPYVSASNGVCGIMLAGIDGHSSIQNNRFKNCGRNNDGEHRLGVIDAYQNCNNVHILNNISEETSWHFVRLNGARNSSVKNNKIYVKIAPDMAVINIGGTEILPENIDITGNTMISNVPLAIGIGGGVTDYSRPFKRVVVENNTLIGLRDAIKFEGVFEGLTIENNKCDNQERETGSAIRIGLGSGITSNDGVSEATSIIQGVKLHNNKINKHNTGIAFDLNGYNGTLDKCTTISNNKIKGADGVAGAGMFVNGVPSLIESNIVENAGVSGAFQIRNSTYHVVNNLMYDCDTNFNQSTGTFFNRGNYADDVLIS